MSDTSDSVALIANWISFGSFLLTAGILIAAWAALGTWRAQVLGGRKIQLAEECLYSAHDFAVQVKLLRLVSPNNLDTEKKIEELRKTLWQFQRSFLIINYYFKSPIPEEIPKAFINFFASLDTNFRILKQSDFQQPPLVVQGASLLAAAAASSSRQHYDNALDIFYGNRQNDPIEATYGERVNELHGILQPILTPDRGCLGSLIDKAAAAVQKS